MSADWSSRRPAPGDRAARSRKVSSGDIELFTQLSGDRNPIHYDERAAAQTSFGEIVVQGGVTTALLNAVVAEDLPGPGTVFLNTTLDFTAPVRPGDTVTAEVTVVSARADKPICELDVTIARDDGVVAVRGSAVTYTFPLD